MLSSGLLFFFFFYHAVNFFFLLFFPLGNFIVMLQPPDVGPDKFVFRHLSRVYTVYKKKRGVTAVVLAH